jgi:hypothetical protein
MEISITPYEYCGYNYSKQIVWIDNKYPSPDPLKKMLWGYGTINYTVSDFKGFFVKKGKAVKFDIVITGRFTHAQEKAQRINAIKAYIDAHLKSL